MRDNMIQTAAGAVGAVFSFLFGEVEAVFYVLVALMCIDFFSGIANAVISGDVDSNICFRGIARKVYILALVAVGHLIDMVLGISTAMAVIQFFYIANEAISVTENAAKIGLPIPQKLVNILQQLKTETEEGGETHGS